MGSVVPGPTLEGYRARANVKGWRTRPVDHYLVSGFNAVSVVEDSPHCDNVDVMVRTLVKFLRAKVGTWMWKRGFPRAYRRLANWVKHRPFAHVVWKQAMDLLASQHLAGPWGVWVVHA